MWRTAQVRDRNGREKQWVQCLNCTICMKYKGRVMSRTTASDSSWTLINFARATYNYDHAHSDYVPTVDQHQQLFEE